MALLFLPFASTRVDELAGSRSRPVAAVKTIVVRSSAAAARRPLRTTGAMVVGRPTAVFVFSWWRTTFRRFCRGRNHVATACRAVKANIRVVRVVVRTRNRRRRYNIVISHSNSNITARRANYYSRGKLSPNRIRFQSDFSLFERKVPFKQDFVQMKEKNNDPNHGQLDEQ